MNVELTAGAIEDIMRGTNVDKPVFQILGQKKIAGGPTDRYRLLLSDGRHTQSSAMLATQQNHLIENRQLEMYTVIQLDKYICNTIKTDKADDGSVTRRVMILLEVTTLASGSEVGERIGDPVAFKLGSKNEGPASEPQQHSVTSNGTVSKNVAPNNNNHVPSKGGFYRGSNQTAPTTPGGTSMRVHPISSLTPYQNRWQIKGRVSQKTAIRTWSNSRGEGRLFSVNFVDESGEIRATGFNDAVDKFYDLLEMGKVFYVSKATLKTANKQYSSVNNDYEMTFQNDTMITPCEDDGSVPTVQFDFTTIDRLGNVAPNSTVDVIGVVRHTGEVATITARATNRELTKRELLIVDQTKTSINLTLWGGDAEKFDGSAHPVLAVKGVKLSDFGGRSLSCLMSSVMMINPDVREAHVLRGWYDSEGQNEDFESYRGENRMGGTGGANWKLLCEVKGGSIGQGDKPDYLMIKGAMASFRKENCLYKACPSENCNKKVVDQGNGMYRCEKCAREYESFKHRLIMGANVQDYTDDHWVTFFQDTAETILGVTADKLGEYKEENDGAFENCFEQANWDEYMFKIRSKVESYNDESRLKSICVSVSPIDYAAYNKHLIEEIEKLASRRK